MIVLAWPDRGSVLLQHAESGLAAVGSDVSAAVDLLTLTILAAAETARPAAHRRIRQACIAHHLGAGSRRVEMPREHASVLYESWYDGPGPLESSTARVPLPRYALSRDEKRTWRVRYDDESCEHLPEYIGRDLSRCYALDTIRLRGLATGSSATPASAWVDGRAGLVVTAAGEQMTTSEYMALARDDGLLRTRREDRR